MLTGVLYGFVIAFVVIVVKQKRKNNKTSRRTGSRSKSRIAHVNDWSRKPQKDFPTEWKLVLEEFVPFYKRLPWEEKTEFEFRVHTFMLNVKVVGHSGLKVTNTDRLVIASGAVIPLFKFNRWQFKFLHQITLCPTSFEILHHSQKADGLTGEGIMEGRMILAKDALYYGFSNERDRKNVMIHEFMHILDKHDGSVDGVPKILMQQTNLKSWLELMRVKMLEIKQGKSDIDPYAIAHTREFFAVVSEYFFEDPERLKQNHPKLYKALAQMFKYE